MTDTLGKEPARGHPITATINDGTLVLGITKLDMGQPGELARVCDKFGIVPEDMEWGPTPFSWPSNRLHFKGPVTANRLQQAQDSYVASEKGGDLVVCARYITAFDIIRASVYRKVWGE